MEALDVAGADEEMVLAACTRALGRRPRALTPDAIASTIGDVAWSELPGWESMSDTEIAIRSGLHAGLVGDVLVVEASISSRRGAFRVDVSELGSLVAQHLERYGECFFNGDVVVVQLDGERLWLFHHEGHFGLVSAT